MIERFALTVLTIGVAYLLKETMSGDREALASLVGIGLFAVMTYRKEG